MGDIAGRIEHVVVLMLENRSFDSMLGSLYPGNPGYDGLSGDESNPDSGSGHDISVWSADATDPASMSIPDPDPGELWSDINMQLFGLNGTPNDRPPPMNGFVDNYIRQRAEPAARYSPETIMHYYSPQQVPVISQLARHFAVSDQWFASAPCQTWPNRFFLHCATAGGYENNSPPHFPYMMETVFNQLEEADQPWRIYFHDFPQTLTLTKLWPNLEHFRFFDEFI
ncbi:MAG TPA: alkaline phosphatase family protein, partial [Gammaproteobacteria bacterium]|nr:alkaline phosphatase family protein [Gammaproteobacteria bacterium]